MGARCVQAYQRQDGAEALGIAKKDTLIGDTGFAIIKLWISRHSFILIVLAKTNI